MLWCGMRCLCGDCMALELGSFDVAYLLSESCVLHALEIAVMDVDILIDG